ncbi:DNRLRE domain-containing protein [Thermoanaerobacterium thermosaccharolyticum]|uniref:DNRLRE domain-containing protein n=1 Tax=Thermoanaerobacterium thermosaccharolyticum TaxID=1517 RepID=UPI001F25B0E1|nr:DNRLRE domain-containing protein [Thermoanaerobacterium thermosaccharolyticum]
MQINPTDDAYISQYFATQNFGSSISLFTGEYLRFGNRPDAYRALLKFDLSGIIPIGNVMTDAKLYLYVNRKDMPDSVLSPQKITIYENLTNFSQLTVTWNTAPSTVITPYTFTVTDSMINSYIGIDIANLAYKWILTPSLNFGITIRGIENVVDTIIGYESTNNVNKPYLEITYEPCPVCPTGPTGPTGATGPVGPTGSGLAAYGYIYNTTANTVLLGGDVTFDSNGPLVGITHTAGTAPITFVIGGTYRIGYTTTASVAVLNSMVLTLNGTPLSQTQYSTIINATELVGEAIITVSAGDILTLRNTGVALTLASGVVNASITLLKLN